MMDKETIINRIVELQKKRQARIEDWNNTSEELKAIETAHTEIEKLFIEIESKYEESKKKISEKRRHKDDIARASRYEKDELDKLDRELKRINDLQANEDSYKAQIEKLRASCLEASWRKENRSDGLGALSHQIDGAIHLAVVESGLLGDKRGLGKSLTNIIWQDFIQAKKVVVICPSDTMDNYIREIRLWTPHRQVIKIGGMKKGERDFILTGIKGLPTFTIILNYEAWRRDPQLIDDINALHVDTLVLDEAHRAKTLSTSTCKGVTKIRYGANECSQCGSDDIHVRTYQGEVNYRSNEHYCNLCGHTGMLNEFSSVKNVMPMTGTPILNKPQELFAQLRLIDLENFSAEKNFLKDFCEQWGNRWRWRYPDGEQRLMKQMGSKYLARDRKAAGVEIPPSKPIEHLITMAEMEQDYPEQYRAYRQCRDYAQIVFNPDANQAMKMLYEIVVIMRLRQCLAWPAGIKLEIKDPETQQFLYYENLNIHQSIKLDKAEELIREINEEGERVILFSQFVDPLEELQRRLGVNSVVYKGGMSDLKKNAIQLDFDVKTAPDKPRWQNALCNYKAAGEGLNFNAASQMIILDEEWNPGRQEQAEGRIDRLGQIKETQIHTIRVENSVDTWMANLQEEKAKIIAGFETEASLMQSAFEAIRQGLM